MLFARLTELTPRQRRRSPPLPWWNTSALMAWLRQHPEMILRRLLHLGGLLALTMSFVTGEERDATWLGVR